MYLKKKKKKSLSCWMACSGGQSDNPMPTQNCLSHLEQGVTSQCQPLQEGVTGVGTGFGHRPYGSYPHTSLPCIREKSQTHPRFTAPRQGWINQMMSQIGPTPAYRRQKPGAQNGKKDNIIRKKEEKATAQVSQHLIKSWTSHHSPTGLIATATSEQ